MPPETRRTTETYSPLGHHEPRFWPTDPAVPSWGRRAGKYQVFVPDPIARRGFTLDSESVAALAQATKALGHLNDTRPRLSSLAALARNLLRSESAASSRIEGVKITHKRLARAVYVQAERRGGDSRATEVLGNVEAMERAIELGGGSKRLSVADIRDIHRTLLRFTEDREIAGVLRNKQSWIGGNDYHPIGAPYVAPPPELVPGLMQDLCRFIARTDIAAVAQAAIAHAQFENIHPFSDGNGRTGRALIYVVLCRRGEAGSYIPPISLVLAGQPMSYIGGLGAYSQGNVSSWCERFAHATERAAIEAERLAAEIEALQAAWIERLGNPRRDAAVRELIAALPAQPVIDVAAALKLTGKSHVAIGAAIARLQQAGILTPLNERKWGRVWECGELLALVDAFEKAVS
ncbi:MAG TPA: Fic family protein [Solirubrobacteraceae bacterium]|jgi:Fic family protein